MLTASRERCGINEFHRTLLLITFKYIKITYHSMIAKKYFLLMAFSFSRYLMNKITCMSANTKAKNFSV